MALNTVIAMKSIDPGASIQASTAEPLAMVSVVLSGLARKASIVRTTKRAVEHEPETVDAAEQGGAHDAADEGPGRAPE